MRVTVALMCMLLISVNAWAYFENYPPYAFKTGAFKHLEVKSLISDQDEYRDGPILVRFHKNKDWSAELLIKDGKTVVVDNAGEPPLPQDVFLADLDHNGQLDFIVLSWNMGTGLGAHEGTVDIYLKEAEGKYHEITFVTMAGGIEDFVDLNNDGKYEVIITNVYSGKDHSYFTYSIYEFKDYRLVNADNQHKGFPKFVWMTYKPNDKDTLKLGADEKKAHVDEKNSSIKYEHVNGLKER